jgi:hypothetical protein
LHSGDCLRAQVPVSSTIQHRLDAILVIDVRASSAVDVRASPAVDV